MRSFSRLEDTYPVPINFFLHPQFSSRLAYEIDWTAKHIGQTLLDYYECKRADFCLLGKPYSQINIGLRMRGATRQRAEYRQ